MYQPATLAYRNHLRKYGPPSVSGYKDMLRTWNPTELNPASLVDIYRDAGARFLILQGVHHDNFDNWNSTYQPWNSVKMGPHRDLVGEWARASRDAGMHFGVAFHHEYSWWWYQPAFGSDQSGKFAGAPYDANQTIADGKDKWWAGYDPRLLYGIDLRAYKGVAEAKWRPDAGIFYEHLDYAHWYATRWALRIMDVINKYDPDFIFTDGDSTQPFSGYATGTGYKCDAIQRVLADYYNRSLQMRGTVDTIGIVKFHPPLHGVATTFEGQFPGGIKTDQVWIGENAVGDWFYRPDFVYRARALILYMLEIVSRDGDYAVNISLKPDGALDQGSRQMLRESELTKPLEMGSCGRSSIPVSMLNIFISGPVPTATDQTFSVVLCPTRVSPNCIAISLHPEAFRSRRTLRESQTPTMRHSQPTCSRHCAMNMDMVPMSPESSQADYQKILIQLRST
jgi:alpha-L-fucosidase